MLNRHNLNIAKLADDSPSRFNLNAIRVTPKETIVTDGHLLLRVTCPEELKAETFPAIDGLTPLDDFEPFNLPTDAALKASKDLPKRSNLPILKHAAVCQNGDPSVLKVVTTDLERHSTYKSVDGNFPDVDRVMPKADGFKFEIALDPHKVKALMEQFIGLLGDNKRPRKVVFKFQTAETACQMEGTEDGQTMTAVLMPVRL